MSVRLSLDKLPSTNSKTLSSVTREPIGFLASAVQSDTNIS